MPCLSILTAAYDTAWPHLRAAETSTRQAHGLDDYRTCSEQQLHPDHWWQQAKQAPTLEKWCPTGISRGSSSFQHIRSTSTLTTWRYFIHLEIESCWKEL